MVVANRYRLIAKIGAGPSATVYLADDVRLRRRVAVKILAEALADEPMFVQRFGAEMGAAAALRHPHIAAIHEWGVDEAPYVVGEYLPLGNLRRLLDRQARLSPAQALQVGLAAARALAYAHERDVIHRALTPANLCFADDARVKITDFGLARAYAEAASTQPMGTQLTAVRYASPEQARGASVDGHADVYALALILIEAVTGTVPFAADTAIATLMGRIDRPPPLADQLGALAGPLGRATTVDPDERLDATGLVTALMAVAGSFDDPAPLPLGTPPADPAGPTDPGAAAGGDPAEAPDDITLIVTPDRRAAAESVGAAEAAPPRDDAPEPVHQGATLSATTGTAVATAERPDVAERAETSQAADPDDARARRSHRRWRIAWIALAVVTIVGGAVVGLLVWQAQRTPTHEIPGVEGLDVQDARSRLEALGFEVRTTGDRRDGTTPGEVLEVDPAAGTRLAEGETVTLTVSEGQTLVTIPTGVVGQTTEAAQGALEELGLTLDAPVEEFSEDVEAGLVVATDPATGERVEKGSAVTLVVSKGPEPRIVPDVSGMTPDEAEAALTSVGLVPEVTTRLDPAIDRGGLIGLDPAPGTSLERGTTVTVVVSSGLSVVVPSLEGVATVPEAIALLQNAGLVASGLSGSGGLSGRPVAFDPPAGQVVAKGSPVDIVTE